MALTKNETGITWSASSSKSVTAAATDTSDAATLDATDFAGSIQVTADNNGTPASGDTVDCYIAWTLDGTTYDTTEHAQWICRLNTYPTNTPGEDPANKTITLDVAGKYGLKLITTNNAGSNGITVTAKLLTHRG